MNEGYESGPCIFLPEGNASISFTLKNEGSISDIFSYEFSEEFNWFDNQNGFVELAPGEEQVMDPLFINQPEKKPIKWFWIRLKKQILIKKMFRGSYPTRLR